MPVVSRIVCEWLIVGFHLGRAKDAFDPAIALCGDELLRPGLLRRLTSALIEFRNRSLSTSNAPQEAEDLELLWAERQGEYPSPTPSEDCNDIRLVLIYEGLLRLEAWLRSSDDVIEPASNPRLAFDLGIELGRSFASWPHSDDDVRWPAGFFWMDTPPKGGWEFRNSERVFELARRLDCTSHAVTVLPFGLFFMEADCQIATPSNTEMYPPHRWAWGVIEVGLSALREHVLHLEKAQAPSKMSPKAAAAPKPRRKVAASRTASQTPKPKNRRAAGGKLKHLGLVWNDSRTVTRSGHSESVCISQNQPWKLFLLYSSRGKRWLLREAIKTEWTQLEIGRQKPNNHNVENANCELKKYLQNLDLTIRSNESQDEQEFAYRIEQINGSHD